MTPSELQWAQLAAFIDGEGAILLNKFNRIDRKDMWLRVVLANTDLRLPKWCKDIFGGVFLAEPRRNPKHSACFRWHVSCQHAAWVLAGCLPFFIIKREQADIALAFQETLGGPGIRVSEEVKARREGMRQQLHAMKRVSPLFKNDSDFPGEILTKETSQTLQ